MKLRRSLILTAAIVLTALPLLIFLFILYQKKSLEKENMEIMKDAVKKTVPFDAQYDDNIKRGVFAYRLGDEVTLAYDFAKTTIFAIG